VSLKQFQVSAPKPSPSTISQPQPDQQNPDGGGSSGSDDTPIENALDAVGRTRIPWFAYPLIALLVAVAAATPFVVRIRSRRRYLEQVAGMERTEQVQEFYRFYLTRFGRMGVAKPEYATPFEFAGENESRLAAFAANETGATFSRLTDSFVQAVYGGIRPDEPDLADYRAFYTAFYKNCRQYLGRPRYYLKFFRL